MSAPGYVKVYRSLLEWEWIGDPNVLSVFIQILLRVNHEEKRWQGHTIPRGSFITSRDTLAKACGLSEKQVRRALDVLEMGRTITRNRAGTGQLVTLEKWEDYQGTDRQQGRSRAASRAVRGPFEGRSRAATEEVQEEKNEKNPRSTPNGVRPNGQATLGLDLGGAEHPAPGPAEDRRDQGVQAVVDHLLAQVREKGIAASLDPSEKSNRYSAANLLRKLRKDYPSNDPVTLAMRLIDFATSDDFERPNCTHMRYFHRHVGRLTAKATEKKRTSNPTNHAERVNDLKDQLEKRFAERSAG